MSFQKYCWIVILLATMNETTTEATRLRAVRELPSSFATMLDSLSEKYPDLDPIVIEHHNFEYHRGTCSAKGSVEDVHVRGISGMDLDIKDMDTDAMRYHVAVNFPTFSLDGRYKMSMNICEHQFEETGGKFSLTLDNLTITTKTNFSNVDGLMQMDYIDVKVDFSDVKFEVDSLLGQPKLGELFTSIMKTHGKETFYTLKPFLKDCAQRTVKKTVNRFIADAKNKRN